MDEIPDIVWLAVAAALAVFLLSEPVKANESWRGYVISWPSSGSGLLMGWTQDGFATKADCIKWVVDQRVEAGKVWTYTHGVTGGCSQ
jgi:hypothetical protein